MKEPRGKLSLRLMILGAGGAVLTAAALVAAAYWQSGVYADLARRDVDTLIVQDLDHITSSVLSLVSAKGEAVEGELLGDLRVARRILTEAGGIDFEGSPIPWTATNQFTKSSLSLVLPAPRVGRRALPVNRDPDVPSPVVDDIADLLDITATLFQRMNERGDMLRVTTTIVDGGERAVGTFIPATLPDGGPNPVIAAVLGGGEYVGRAYVVNSWFLTAYGPLLGADGRVTGMIYVGRPQAEAESLIRKSIVGTRIGETGYVYVLSGRGENRGRYVISQNGLRDGEDVWNERDEEGRYVIQDIIRKALALGTGELGTVEYWWKNPGESRPRLKIARIAYYAPWDWVIGTSAYEDELVHFHEILENGRRNMVAFMAAAAAAVALAGVATSIFFAGKILKPISELSRAAEAFTRGNLDAVVRPGGPVEVRDLAGAFNHMAERLKQTLSDLRERESKYRNIFEGAVEGIFQSTLQGRVLSVNSALAVMLRYDSPEDFAGAVRDIRSDVYLVGADRDAIVARIRDDGFALGVETRFRRKDGTSLWVAISARALRDADGNLWGIEGFISDIDVRKHAEESLRKTLAEREELLREIHHRVNNNLQILASLLSLQSRSDPEGREALERFAARIQAMSLIHEMAYGSENVRGISVNGFARAIAEYLFQAHRAEFGDIRVDVTGEEVGLDLDRAIPCGLLLNEILANSFRHAFPPPRSGTVFVRCSAGTDGGTILVVGDDGIGAAVERRAGMGLELIELLSLQLSATLTVEWTEGTKYSIRIPPSRSPDTNRHGKDGCA